MAKQPAVKSSALKTRGDFESFGRTKAVPDEAWITMVGDDGITVRFLTEPEGWEGFHEYFDESIGHYAPVGADEDVSDKSVQPRFLALALDVDEDRVISLRMVKTLANQVYDFYENYGTLLDRDYHLGRTGKSVQTRYNAIPQDKKRRAISKYLDDAPDLAETLGAKYRFLETLRADIDKADDDDEEAFRSSSDDDDDDDDREDVTTSDDDDVREEISLMLDEDEDALNDLSLDEVRALADRAGVAEGKRSKAVIVKELIEWLD